LSLMRAGIVHLKRVVEVCNFWLLAVFDL
jgi:hypothetical protein